jgi:hypothetical protein
MQEFQSFRVSEFQSFSVSEFQCFRVSVFQSYPLLELKLSAFSDQHSAVSFPWGQKTCIAYDSRDYHNM